MSRNLHLRALDRRGEGGALRVLPASHTVESQVSLRRLQASHGLNTAHADWADSTFGVPGPELPCTILESTPGVIIATIDGFRARLLCLCDIMQWHRVTSGSSEASESYSVHFVVY